MRYVYLTLSALFGVMDTVFLVRVLTSWIAPESRFYDALLKITEPFILPARAALERSETIRNFPIDLPFLITWILMNMLESLFIMVA